MFRRTVSNDEQVLAQRLEREAQASRPEFSASLDRRIRSRVRQFAAESAASPWQSLAARWRLGWGAVAVVALVAVLVATAVWWPSRLAITNMERQLAGPTERTPQVGATAAPGDLPAVGPADGMLALTALPDEALDQVDRWLGPEGADRPWSDLRHDARLAMDMLLDPLPLDLVAGEMTALGETL